MTETPPRFRFTRADRLSGRDAFTHVYAGRTRRNIGPLGVVAIPNDTGRHRLGLSVPRRVGTAVARHRIKRRLREACRLNRHDWPGSYDIVLAVQPHETLSVDRYARLLAEAVERLHRTWQKRQTSDESD